MATTRLANKALALTSMVYPAICSFLRQRGEPVTSLINDVVWSCTALLTLEAEENKTGQQCHLLPTATRCGSVVPFCLTFAISRTLKPDL